MARVKLTSQSPEISLIEINRSNISTMETMNSILFPVTYEPSFSQQVLLNPNYFGFIFCKRKVPLGLCTYQINLNGVYVMTFGILKDFRRRGIGTMCMKIIEERIQLTLGSVKIRLHVHETNTEGLHFYFKMNYKKVGVDYLYYSEMVPKTAIILEKQINR